MGASIPVVTVALVCATLVPQGTALASVPASVGASVGAAPSVVPTDARPGPPHRFRARFHTLAQCQFQARHDHPNRPADWDCRRGANPNNPWEYWGD